MWKAVALWALLAFFQPEVSAVISPGFDEKHLRVPSSIFNHDKTACEDFTYLTEDHDCTDIHSNNTEIQVSLTDVTPYWRASSLIASSLQLAGLNLYLLPDILSHHCAAEADSLSASAPQGA